MLSAVVITRNEQKNIKRCLESLSFCDEILVVDAESTDDTRQIAESCGAKVLVRRWSGYSEQKNFAVSVVSSEWVLSVDADEVVTPNLRAEIIETLKHNPTLVAYSIPRKTLHSGKWIRWGGWYPNRLIRLFRAHSGKWVGDEIHEYWDFTGESGKLNEDLLHYSFESVEDQVNRNNRYSTLGSRALKKSGRRFSMFFLCYKPISKFVETYLIKLGFLDGYRGLIISVSAAYSVFLKWAKLWELEVNEKNN